MEPTPSAVRAAYQFTNMTEITTIAIKIPAIKVAVAHKDLSTVRQMVKDLESDDAAVRFYAINGLRRLTGENFGYLYYEEATERKPATKRWQAWLEQVEQSAKREGEASPATQP